MKNLLYRGERNVAISAMALAVAFSLTACGDDVTEVTQVNENSVISVLEAGQELSKQECSKGNAGEILFVTDSAMVFMCNGEKWVSLKGAQGETGAKGEKGADGVGKDGADGNDGTSCMAKSVENAVGLAGLEVTCGKDVIDTIWNGEDLIATPGTMGSFVDSRDGQIYKTIVIGSQTWMAENLNYDPGEGPENLYSYAWSGCYGEGELTEEEAMANCSKYGRLYTWMTAMDYVCGIGKECNLSEDVQGVCPEGWHLPSLEEFRNLGESIATSVSDYDTYWHYHGAGVKLKAVDEAGWETNSDATKGTDVYGFSALPAGGYSVGNFVFAGSIAVFWSATRNGNSINAFYMRLDHNSDEAYVDDLGMDNGFSVRCLKDK